MSDNEDDDDRFLYGSDIEDDRLLSVKRSASGSTEAQHQAKRSKTFENSHDGVTVENEEYDDVMSDDDDADNNSDSDSDSDSDIEIMVSTGPDTSVLDSNSFLRASGTESVISVAAADAPVAITPTAEVTSTTTTTIEDADGNTTSKTTTTTTTAQDAAQSSEALLDLNEPGEFNEKSVLDIDPEMLKEKPWRQPGANLSEYFNYGFNEYTWMEYLHKQEHLLKEYNPRRVLMGLLTLQQQGKLQGDSGMDMKDHPMNMPPAPPPNRPMPPPTGNDNNHSGVMRHPPPGFPPLPMFGGFAPFGMPGMMPPMSQQQQQPQQQNALPPNNLQKN